MFLFVVVSRQTKSEILCALCGSTLLTTLRPIEGRLCGESLSAIICVNLRLIACDDLAGKFAHAGNKTSNLPHHILRGRNIGQDDTGGASFLIGLDFRPDLFS